MKLLLGDCLTVLKDIPDNSIDSLVTDPPAGISFMGKDWDDDKGGPKEWILWMSEVMKECLRVLKPGAHGLVWAIPRTNHWTGMALEEAGFEVRDVVSHLFGSGFPKSLNISKAIDKAAGAKRGVVGYQNYSAPDIRGNSYDQAHVGDRERLGVQITTPSTDEAKQWDGWGTALKPAVEFWYLVRKPCSEKTVAANVLKWGTGGINIDVSRITTNWETDPTRRGWQGKEGNGTNQCEGAGLKNPNSQGRFPSNLVLSHSPYCTDDQCFIFSNDQTNEAFRVLVESLPLNFQDGYRFYRDFYGELFRLVAKPGQTLFQSLNDVDAYIRLYLRALGYNHSCLFESRLSKHDDWSRFVESQNIFSSKSFVEVNADDILSDKLCKAYQEEWLASPNSKCENNTFEYDNHENVLNIPSNTEQCRTLCFLNIYLASPINQGFNTNMCSVKMLDEQSGIRRSAGSPSKTKERYKAGDKSIFHGQSSTWFGDSGGASRFFYCAKVSSSERNAGLESQKGYEIEGVSLNEDENDNPNTRGRKENPIDRISQNRKLHKTGNFHPTVKAKKLMGYLINLITPPNGVVLDPFMGSGSTGITAKELGFEFIGIEQSKEYLEIAEKRIG